METANWSSTDALACWRRWWGSRWKTADARRYKGFDVKALFLPRSDYELLLRRPARACTRACADAGGRAGQHRDLLLAQGRVRRSRLVTYRRRPRDARRAGPQHSI